MRFENPAMLYLLVLPLISAGLLLFGIWSRKRILRRFGKKATVEAQLTRPSPYLRAAKGICLVLGVGALVVAAARPQYGGRIRMLKKTGIDIVVALDFSKSMLAQDTPPSRIERAKLELAEFINRLTGDRIGLVAFAGDTMRFPLTTDYAAATAFWKNLGPYDMPVGGTAIGKALTAATRMLRPETEKENETLKGRSKAVVLITDGEDHFGDPVEAAKEAAAQNIIIHTVGIGSDSPELIPRLLEDGTTMGYQKNEEGEYITTALTKDNEETLREIASTTSGRYFKAGRNFSGMIAVIEEIRKMKQSDVESRQQEVYEDVFQWFLIPAFVLLLLAFTLPERFIRFGKGRRKSVLAGLLPLVMAFHLAAGEAEASENESQSRFFMSENSDVKKGNSLMKEGKLGDALQSYQAATRALPDRAAVHLNRGLALYRTDEKQLDQAMQAFKTATDTKGSDAVRARAHFNLGNTFFKKEDYAEAIRQYKKSLMLAPGNKDVAWNLELAKQRQKQKEEQQKKDQENQENQNQDQQDQQDQDEQNQDEQNQDEQNQDQQNKEDEQKQQEQKKEEQKQDEQKKEEQKQQEQQEQQEQQQPQQPKTKQEVEQLLNSLDNQDDNLQKQMAKQRAARRGGMPRKDW